MDEQRGRLMDRQRELEGKVIIENILPPEQGNLEFSLLAEGIRKLALLWLLIQNGVLQSGSFWDEPEPEPKAVRRLIGASARWNAGVATHDTSSSRNSIYARKTRTK